MRLLFLSKNVLNCVLKICFINLNVPCDVTERNLLNSAAAESTQDLSLKTEQ